MNLPALFEERMKLQLKENYGEFIQTYAFPAVKGIRVNTLKISLEEFEKISPLKLEGKVPWEQSGFYVSGEGLGKTIEHAAGAYYVQEPSAMCAVPELEIKGGERVLDLCAAPGGKTTQIAAYSGGNGVLVCNEINYDRYKILKSNVERAGIKNVVVTCASPAELGKIFGGYFDKILVDAPCSGEGMFKKEENAIPEWSVENVLMCAERQAEILGCADMMLKRGGTLVYSTCTFSAEEDERQIDNFLNSHKNYTLKNNKKLYPHEVRGEGHFCAALQKGEGEENDLKAVQPQVFDKLTEKLYRGWESETLKIKLQNLLCENGNAAYIGGGLPDVSAFQRKGILKALSCGVYLGGKSLDGKRFEPSHRLAMCLKPNEVNHIETDRQTALGFLRGLTFNCENTPNGWYVVTHNGLPLGWCKVSGGIAKNHLPKGLRI